MVWAHMGLGHPGKWRFCGHWEIARPDNAVTDYHVLIGNYRVGNRRCAIADYYVNIIIITIITREHYFKNIFC
jgi:hypothetical protein